MLNTTESISAVPHSFIRTAPHGAAGRPHPAGLLSLATAVPPHRISQAEAAETMHHIFADIFANSETMSGVFASTGIRHRYAARPLDWYLQPMGWPERTGVYVEEGTRLFIEVANKALDAAGVRPDEVDAVVFVSTSGIATPSLDAVVHKQMGFRSDIERVPVFGLGCAGGVTGLAIAARIAEAQPGATVLMVTVELSTLSFRLDRPDKASLISTALFGDGAAACVLRAGETGLAVIEGAGEHLWPDTLGIMGWSMDPVGFGVILVPDVPSFAATNLRPAVEGNPRPHRAKCRGYRAFRLPSRRHQGGRGDRALLQPAAGLARSRARRAGRLRQHVRADRAVHPAACAGGRPAGAGDAGLDGAGLHRLLRLAGAGGVRRCRW